MQPGQTISPGGGSQPEEEQAPQNETPAEVAQTATSTEPAVTMDQQAPEQYTAPKADISTNEETLKWTASEFIEHQKPSGWYGAVIISGVLLSAFMYFILKDVTSVSVIGLAAVLFAVVGSHKPESKTYELSPQGIKAGDKVFNFDYFKSYAVIQDGAMVSVQLMPLKKYIPPLSIYFPPDLEHHIIDIFADYLPVEDRNIDPIDRLMKRVKF